MYEFSKVSEVDNITTVMTEKWRRVCEILCCLKDENDPINLSQELRSFRLIEKNIFHKKPSSDLLPVMIEPVRINNYQ